MCGICGEITSLSRKINRGTLSAMLGVLHHRGPDDEGVYINAGIGLGHKRLSIIDLQTGHQPIGNEDETLQIVFNGEIYNFQDLKVILESKGHQFKTKTDTEVILHMYEEYGTSCVTHLRGMFAFAIWNEKKKELFCARDRVGKKPLYYTFINDSFIFASEIKALLQYPGIQKKVSVEAIDYFLTYNYIPPPTTIFQGVYALMPAHYMRITHNKIVEINSYWDIDFSKKLNISFTEAQHMLRQKLKEAVKLRMISDVPLGAFLSGGIDSSIVVALMSELSTEPVKTFSIGFEEESFSELSYARLVAERYGTDHHEFIVKSNAIEILPKLVWHYDQPYGDSSALPSYYVARETRKFVAVALNGDGGDESFAGYLRHKAGMISESCYHVVPQWFWHRLYKLMPTVSKQKNILRYLKRFAEAAGENPARRNVLWHCLFRDELRARIYSKQMLHDIASINTFALLEDIFTRTQTNYLLDRILYTDIKTYLPGDLLVKMDIATMIHSLEARSPFLDHELMGWTAQLPVSFKMNYFNGKYILKKAFKSYLPKPIIKRQKMGFGVPLEAWFRQKPLNTYLKDHVLSMKSKQRGYFKHEVIKKLIDEHEHGAYDHGYRLWALLILEIWHRLFID